MKERIQQKAEELFERYGIRSVTMDEIAGQLGISKKTIYQSFSDKDELVDAVFQKRLEENEKQCLFDKKEAENAIHEIFLAWNMIEEMLAAMNPSILYDLEKYHPSVFRKFLQYKNDFLYRVIYDNLERGIKEELYRGDFTIEIIARFRIGTIMMGFNMDVFPKNKFKLVDIEEQIILHFLHGIATPKGVKVIQKYYRQKTGK